MSKRPTSVDVAKQAGVSSSTVSRVFSPKTDVTISEDTRRKVIAAAEELGYRRNSFARALRTGKSHAIGIAIGNLAVEMNTTKFRAIAALIHERGYEVIPRGVIFEEDVTSVSMDFANRQVEGAIFLEGSADSSILRKNDPLVESGIPVVVSEEDLSFSVDCVAIDRVYGGYLATSHLIELGHKRIGFIHVASSTGCSSRRMTGYKAALEECGIPFCEELLAIDKGVSGCECEAGYSGARELIRKNPGMTAIFCAADVTAIAAMRAIQEEGLRIPEDISIVGFDNIQLAPYVQSPLTTVAQPVGEWAKRVVAQLFRRMEHEGSFLSYETVLLKPKLVIRSSSSAVSSKVNGISY